MDGELLAATARTDVTPPPGIAHANWGAQSHERAAGVDMPLWATSLALSDGDTTVVVVDLDVLYLWPEDARRVRTAVADATELPRPHVRISYTHTHSGPSLNRDTWAEAGIEQIDPYLAALEDDAAGVAWKAVRDLEPARMAAGSGTCGIAVNRRFRRPEDGEVIVGRNPDGPVDREVGVLRIDAADGDPLATVLSYACHPITAGPDNDLITPDYPGQTKRTVEAATGSTCLFLQGATGDIGPVRGVARGGIEEYRPLGRRLGHAASQVWWGLDPSDRAESYSETLPSGAPLAVYDVTCPDPEPVDVGVRTTAIDLPVRDLPDPESLRDEYERHADRLASLREAGADESDISAAAKDARQAEIRTGVAERYADDETVSLELQVFALGDDVVLAAVPGEPFVEIGLGVKDGSPYDHTFFSGYTNAGIAYVPTADAYPEGGYEVEITPFAPDAAETLVCETVAALEAERGE